MNDRVLTIWICVICLLTACSSDEAKQVATEDLSTPELTIPATEPSDADDDNAFKEPEVTSTSETEDLTGKLYYPAIVRDQQQLLSLDIGSGEEEIVFVVPELGWLSSAAVSPDGQQIVLSYSAPPEIDQVQTGFTDLYLMPADGSEEPTPFVLRDDPSEAFFNVSWPQDDTIYYAHVAQSVDDSGFVTYDSQIERIAPDGTNREILASGASWPRPANDGSALAYINNDLELILAEADGSNSELILDSDEFQAIDSPLFSPSLDQICFSAVNPLPQSVFSIWDRVMGVAAVEAHSVPSDWWCLYLNGSDMMIQLTTLNAIGLYGDFNQAGTHMAFIATDGIYTMRSDGNDLQKIKDIAAFGSVDWVP